MFSQNWGRAKDRRHWGLPIHSLLWLLFSISFCADFLFEDLLRIKVGVDGSHQAFAYLGIRRFF